MIEETPAPGISDRLRHELSDAAVRLGKAVNYQSAGTVEFIYDVQTQQFYFLEVNTRLQVEHGVTESINKVDLVEWMVKQASGDFVSAVRISVPAAGTLDPSPNLCRRSRENFQPSAGILHQVAFPDGIRCDGWWKLAQKSHPITIPCWQS